MKRAEKITELGTEEKAPKKKSTSPWAQEGSRWLPDITRLPKKHVGFRPRFVDKEKVTQRQELGWVVAKPADYGLDIKGTKYQKGTLILMELPEDWARDREEFYTKLTDQRATAGRIKPKQKVAEIAAEAGDESLEIYRDEYTSEHKG